MNIVDTNIQRFVNKAIKYNSGIIITEKDIEENMISNFIEHCYNNKEIYNNNEEKILNLNFNINGDK